MDTDEPWADKNLFKLLPDLLSQYTPVDCFNGNQFSKKITSGKKNLQLLQRNICSSELSEINYTVEKKIHHLSACGLYWIGYRVGWFKITVG